MKPIPLQYKDITCTLCNKILGVMLKQQRYGGKTIHEAYSTSSTPSCLKKNVDTVYVSFQQQWITKK